MNFSSLSQLLTNELHNTKCFNHKMRYQQCCLEYECIQSDKLLLCQICLQDHAMDHKIVALLYAFSNELLEELKEIIRENEDQILQDVKYNVPFFSQIDESFDNVEKEILKLLQESRSKMKKLILVKTNGMRKFVDLKTSLETLIT